MVGLELPVLAMEHMYLLTEDMPEVAEINASTGAEVLHAVDFDGEIYLRQERQGMLMGTYEKACKPWSETNTPWEFGHQLLEPDIDQIAPSLEIGFTHFPAFEKAGIKQIINGPFTFAPDGNPLVGPVEGMTGIGLPVRLWLGLAKVAALVCRLPTGLLMAIPDLMSGPWMSADLAIMQRCNLPMRGCVKIMPDGFQFATQTKNYRPQDHY